MTNCISECGYNEINTYQDMNEQIVRLLRFSNTGPSLYAAKYIEDLQAEVERLQKAVAAEREACAAIADYEADEYGPKHPAALAAFAVAASIRARGNQ